MTQLFSFKTPTPLSAQLAAISSQLTPQEKAVFSSLDCTILNRDDDQQSFVPLTIDDVRRLHTEIVQAPLVGDSRQIVLGNLEQASLPAQQAMLKILEEPPERVQLIVTTLSIQKLLPTILSRCQIVSIPAREESSTKTLPQMLLDAIDQPTGQQLPLHQIFALSEEYKERVFAQELLLMIITHIHHHPDYPTELLTQQLQATVTGLQQLEKNGNVRLVIEDILFDFGFTRQTLKNRL